jgi:hypothetical protein
MVGVCFFPKVFKTLHACIGHDHIAVPLRLALGRERSRTQATEGDK